MFDRYWRDTVLNKLQSFTLAAALSVAALSITAPVFADSHALSATEAVVARSALMKSLGGTIRTLGALEGDAMVDAANIYVEGFGGLAALFPEGSGEGTKALPAIWENWEGFEAVIAKGDAVAAAMLEAATAGDKAAFGAAAKGLGPVCGECHTTFRASR